MAWTRRASSPATAPPHAPRSTCSRVGPWSVVAALAVVGIGSKAEVLRTQAQAFGLWDRVRFLGLVGDTNGFYPAPDLLCVPSRAEGLPLESQACGVPAVAARVGGVAAALCPETSNLVPTEDHAALAEALAAGLPRPPRPTRLRVARSELRRGCFRLPRSRLRPGWPRMSTLLSAATLAATGLVAHHRL
jgi:glycosyltransferase involved in cell wall biosynthesis